MKFSQYIPLTACPPLLALISLHESADSSGMAPRIAKKLKKKKEEVKKKCEIFPSKTISQIILP